ncbi:MAG TPA: hypothetical protein VKC34_08935, partial [Blastocatellia bacterium]|nr:hypothetical protein [Blastocatellia bacterium]
MKFTLPEQSQQEDPFEDEELSRNYRESFLAFISELPLLSPPAIADELERLGYKGQDEQRRALALMAYRHVRRLKRLHVDGEPRNG